MSIHNIKGVPRYRAVRKTTFCELSALARTIAAGATVSLFVAGIAGCALVDNDPPVLSGETVTDGLQSEVVETGAPDREAARLVSRGNSTPTANATPTATPTASVTPTTNTMADVAPTATTASATPSTYATNSIDIILNDMRLMNDAVLAGIPTQYGFSKGPGHVTMGADPRGTATPTYWTPYNSYYKSVAYWNALLPWFVVFDGVGNAASNTRVELRNLKAYYKSRATGRWSQVSDGVVDGSNYPKHLTGSNVTAPDLRNEPSGTRSIRPAGGDFVFHGWCCGKQTINAPDVAGIYVTMQARLIVSDPSRADDRARSMYLVHVGADYYPEATTGISAFVPSEYAPGVGMGRAKLVRNEWQSFSFATVDVGVVESTGKAMTEAEFRAAPPPLE
jgi:hypothetical protein